MLAAPNGFGGVASMMKVVVIFLLVLLLLLLLAMKMAPSKKLALPFSLLPLSFLPFFQRQQTEARHYCSYDCWC